MLNLRRLVDVPPERPIRLTTALEVDADLPPPADPPDWSIAREARPALSALRRTVAIREQQVRIARGAFLPSVAFQTSYARQAFPSGVFDLDTDWLTDWTASLSVSVPLFNGGSRFAALQQAHADANAARLQLTQAEEGMELEYRQALGDRDRSWAEIDSRRRTAEMADRVNDLTLLRYEKGLATHLEVSEARLGLLTARTQLAQALADYFIAEATLLRTLGGSREALR
jgi:outer membrane protein